MAVKSNRKPVAAKRAANRLNDHIADRVCRIADGMLRVSAHSIKQRWDLRGTDLRLLNILDADDGISVREISRRAHVDQAWVSRLLQDLEGRGLVERRKDEKDSRLSLVMLTEHGRTTLDEFRPFATKSEKLLLKGIDAKLLKSMLDQLQANLQAMLDGDSEAMIDATR